MKQCQPLANPFFQGKSKDKKPRNKNFTKTEISVLAGFVKKHTLTLYGKAGHCSQKVIIMYSHGLQVRYKSLHLPKLTSQTHSLVKCFEQTFYLLLHTVFLTNQWYPGQFDVLAPWSVHFLFFFRGG